MLSIVAPNSPAITKILVSCVRMQLVKRTRLYTANGRSNSRDILISSAEMLRIKENADGATLLRGVIKAGSAGRETSWTIEGSTEVQVSQRTLTTFYYSKVRLSTSSVFKYNLQSMFPATYPASQSRKLLTSVQIPGTHLNKSSVRQAAQLLPWVSRPRKGALVLRISSSYLSSFANHPSTLLENS